MMIVVGIGSTTREVTDAFMHNYFCMHIMDALLFQQKRCVGRHQGDGVKCFCGWGFNMLQGKFISRQSHPDHGLGR